MYRFEKLRRKDYGINFKLQHQPDDSPLVYGIEHALLPLSNCFGGRIPEMSTARVEHGGRGDVDCGGQANPQEGDGQVEVRVRGAAEKIPAKERIRKIYIDFI